MSGNIWTPMRETIARDLWRQGVRVELIARRLDGAMAPGEISARARVAGWERDAAVRGARGVRWDHARARTLWDAGHPVAAIADAVGISRQALRSYAVFHRWPPRAQARRQVRARLCFLSHDGVVTTSPVHSAPMPPLAPDVPDPAQLTLVPVAVGPQPFDVARIDPVTLYRAERAHRAAQFRTTVLPAVQSRLDAMSAAEQATKYQLRGRPRKDGRTARLQGAA